MATKIDRCDETFGGEVEDRLSDALHEALTARFVDRRTRKLLKGIGADLDMSATIKDTGEVYVDDDLIGRLDGLKFTADTSQSGLEAQALATAAQKAVGPEVDRRLTSLSSGTHQIFTLSDTGHIMWGGMDVGRIAPSGSVFTPDAQVIGGELGQALANCARFGSGCTAATPLGRGRFRTLQHLSSRYGQT